MRERASKGGMEGGVRRQDIIRPKTFWDAAARGAAGQRFPTAWHEKHDDKGVLHPTARQRGGGGAGGEAGGPVVVRDAILEDSWPLPFSTDRHPPAPKKGASVTCEVLCVGAL